MWNEHIDTYATAGNTTFLNLFNRKNSLSSLTYFEEMSLQHFSFPREVTSEKFLTKCSQHRDILIVRTERIHSSLI